MSCILWLKYFDDLVLKLPLQACNAITEVYPSAYRVFFLMVAPNLNSTQGIGIRAMAVKPSKLAAHFVVKLLYTDGPWG